MKKMVGLLAAWATEKQLDKQVLRDESLADHFFRYLEETYGCGNLASHVAHGCMMAFDEYVVSHTFSCNVRCPAWLLGKRFGCSKLALHVAHGCMMAFETWRRRILLMMWLLCVV